MNQAAIEQMLSLSLRAGVSTSSGPHFQRLYEELFSGGLTLGILNKVAASIPLSDESTEQTRATEIDTIRTWLKARTDALADDPVIAG